MRKLPDLPDFTLPTWLSRGEPLTLAHASRRYWQKVYDWLTWPLDQIDVDTCAVSLLNLLAYQRNITRFPGESLALFRLRVKHAFINARDAGERAGFERIFSRLGIGDVQTLERQIRYDWDVVLLRISDEQLSRDNLLMMNLVRQYGRTCRRYFFDVLTRPQRITACPAAFDNDATVDAARLRFAAKDMVFSPDSVLLAPGEQQHLQLIITPSWADDVSWQAHTADGSTATLTRHLSGVTVKGITPGVTAITATLPDSGLRAQASVTVRIPDRVSVKMRFASIGQPLFYVTGQEINGGFTVDYGDGIDGTEYRIDNTGAVFPLRDLPAGTEFVLTVRRSTTCRFYGSRAINPVTEVIGVSGSRSTLDSMFQNCRELSVVHPGAFDATPDVRSASWLFAGCTLLQALPAALFTHCPAIRSFESAFRGCTALATLPGDLFRHQRQATSFKYTFYDCRALHVLPEGLFDDCTAAVSAERTFSNCRSLGTVPAGLFSPCQALTTAAAAFANCDILTTIPDDGVFAGCSSITDFTDTFTYCLALSHVPGQTFHGCTSASVFRRTFQGCRALETLGEGLFDGCVSASVFDATFLVCGKLRAVPAGLFDDVRHSATQFTQTFASCRGLVSLPDGLLSGMTQRVSFKQTFEYCTSLRDTGRNLFAGSSRAQDFSLVFRDCYALERPGDGMFAGCHGATTFTDAFSKCRALVSLPAGMFRDTLSAETVWRLFEGCEQLQSLPAGLFAGMAKVTDFDNVFVDCKSLSHLPGDTFAGCEKAGSFTRTFTGCSSLEVVEDGIFAECRSARSFSFVFSGCSALRRVPARIFAGTAMTYFGSAFQGCSRLQGDINTILHHDSYADMTNCSGVFLDCENVTGSGLAFIEKLPNATYRSGALRNCFSLSDFEDIPLSWR